MLFFAAPFRLTMVTSVRALKRPSLVSPSLWFVTGWLIKIFQDELSLSSLHFNLRSTGGACLDVFFWDSFFVWMRSSHFFWRKDYCRWQIYKDPLVIRFKPASLEKLRLWPFVPAILANEEGTKRLALSTFFGLVMRKINSADAPNENVIHRRVTVKIQKQTGRMLEEAFYPILSAAFENDLFSNTLIWGWFPMSFNHFEYFDG